jgi:hypothetical protein
MLKPETKRDRPNVNKPSVLLAVALAALIVCGSTSLLRGVLAQETQGASSQPGSTLTLNTSFAGKKQVAPDEQIELMLNRAPTSAEGRLAVILGQTDLTNLFTSTETVLRYNPQLLPLPLGESEMTVKGLNRRKRTSRSRRRKPNSKTRPLNSRAKSRKQASKQASRRLTPRSKQTARSKPRTRSKPPARNRPKPRSPRRPRKRGSDLKS